jgi:hypothetical protein
MKIKRTQTLALAELARLAFEDRLVLFVQAHCKGAEEIPRAGVHQVVHSLLERATSHGLTTERQMATYVVTGWVLGTEFASTFPHIRCMLDDKSIGAEAKTRQLMEYATDLLRGDRRSIRDDPGRSSRTS